MTDEGNILSTQRNVSLSLWEKERAGVFTSLILCSSAHVSTALRPHCSFLRT
jgi:hypothetical protein